MHQPVIFRVISMFGCQKIKINANSELRAILEYVCEQSNKLHNCGIYLSRQTYFKTGKVPSKFDLHKELRLNKHFQALYSHVSQQCLISVAEDFKAYFGLLRGIKKGTVTSKVGLPKYRKPGLNLVTFPHKDVKLNEKGLRFPLGGKVKAWFGIRDFYIPMPTNLCHKSIVEYRILPKNREFYLVLVYKVVTVESDVNPDSVLGIDPGLGNWLTCVSNVGTSIIVDGLHLKSLNQWYHKRMALLMSRQQQQGVYSKQMYRVTEKRNRQALDAVNKAARLVLDHCLKNKIGTIVFGWNKGQKQKLNLGSRTNQNFIYMPTGKLKIRISQLCEQYGILFLETEESYTSKSSFLDSDILPTFGEKPEGWKESGTRITRGLYQSKDGIQINADCNGAANILRKVSAKLSINLDGVSRGALIAPLRVQIWTS